jgi:CBS domain containing-hemolysin-like protein
MRLFRPVLRALDAAANALVRTAGVEPSQGVAVGHSPEALRRLFPNEARSGTWWDLA